MMSYNLISYALGHGEINVDVLVDLVKQMDESMALRFTEAVLGIVNQNEITKGIPVVSNIYEHKDCRLVAYNYLQDIVDYEYDEEVMRYFESKEEAEKFSSGKLSRWSGERKISDKCSYEGKQIVTEAGTCSFDKWFEGAK